MMRNEYRAEQLKKMLAFEEKQEESAKYGAHLSHWGNDGNPINLDEGALKVLIAYYEEEV